MAESMRIVLFGMPSAGKSSLLGALVQAGQNQGQLLGGRLDDAPESLLELHKRVYESKSRPTQEEVVLHAFTFQPADATQGPIAATLIDCDGRIAQNFLTGSKSLDGAEGALGQAIKKADILLVAVDASAPAAQLDRDFAQSGDFLRWFEEHRGRHNEVAGLPVYLVLTKCDLLAKADDSFSRWMQRIEEGKRKIDQRFRASLANAQQSGRGLFGAIDLRLWATAVRRPALTDRPAKANEPLGVAELFRQVLESGQGFKQLRQQTHRRLLATVTGLALLVGVMGLLAAFFFLTRPSADVTALENAVRVALPGSTPADRLREPLDERLKQLADIQANPAFAKLQDKTRDEVKQAVGEIEAYQQLSKDFKTKVRDPRGIAREEDLKQNEESLLAFAIPAVYVKNWSETKLVLRLEQWQNDLKKLRAAVAAEESWVRERLKEGEQLRKKGGLVIAQTISPKERDEWFSQVKDYLEKDFRYKRSDRIPGSSSLTYEQVYNFDRVDLVKRTWDKSKKVLEDLRTNAQ